MDTDPNLINLTPISEKTEMVAAIVNHAKSTGVLYKSNIYVVHSVIDYYLTGELHLPTDLCTGAVDKELDMWGLSVENLASCCRARYEKGMIRCSIMKKLNDDFVVTTEQKVRLQNEMREQSQLRTQIYHFLEDPFSSKPARIWSIFVVLLILASIVAFAFETLPDGQISPRENTSGRKGPKRTNENFILRNPHKDDRSVKSENFDIRSERVNETCVKMVSASGERNVSDVCKNSDTMWWANYILRQSSMPFAIQVLEITTLLLLSIELALRFGVNHAKKSFLVNPYNILDIVSTVPTWAVLAGYYVMKNTLHAKYGYVYVVVVCLRVLRLLRILRLARQYKPLKVILLTVQSCHRQLVLLFMLFVFAGVMSGALVFYTEIQEDIFPSIMHAYWWAIITLTTIGYGDYVPVTALGRVVGAGCAICGILSITIIIPVISNHFIIFYDGLRMNEKKTNHPKRAAPDLLITKRDNQLH